jgi:hypothetical protein
MLAEEKSEKLACELLRLHEWLHMASRMHILCSLTGETSHDHSFPKETQNNKRFASPQPRLLEVSKRWSLDHSIILGSSWLLGSSWAPGISWAPPGLLLEGGQPAVSQKSGRQPASSQQLQKPSSQQLQNH